MTTQIKTLAPRLALAALWTTSCTDRQDAATLKRGRFHVYQPDPATPAEEWVASFAGQEAGICA